jgi:P22 coat protein - gene protein 5
VPANSFLTPTRIARVAIGALVQDLVLPRLVSRDAESEFSGAQGTVVNVRIPPTVTGGGVRTYGQAQRDAGTPIVLDYITETTIPVTMGPEIYKGTPCTDEQLTFTIENFNAQVLDPLMQIVGQGAEAVLVAEMNGFPADGTIVPALDGSDLHDAILEARMVLNKRNVPQVGRTLAVSPEIELMLLQDPANRLVRYDASGSSEALRNATIGRLYGMDTVVANELAPNSFIIFNRDAFTFVMRAPAIPAGAPFAQGVSYQGLALRFLRDYDSAFLQDRAIVSTYAGAETLDAQRAIRVVAA